jgi:uncharacterized NAD(P)/FAD-binding protein YdhS
VDQQRRFLRHLRPFWNAARHRLAPEIHAQLRHAMQSGMLCVTRGRCIESGGALRVSHSHGEDGPFDLVFECTGTRPDIVSPLITSLVGQGLARPDAHGLGLIVASDGSVLAASGARPSRLFALGPLGHGSLYEITAVPEIVAQSAAMAQRISAQLESSNTEQRPTRRLQSAHARAG